MGLPIFITPVEPDVASRATEKVAAGPRSSIRRQRTVRGGPQARSAEIRRRRIQDTLENEARENQQIHPPNGPDIASIATLQARANRLFENERMALGDPLSWERQHPLTVTLREFDSPILPPAPDPELEARISREREIERLHQVRRDLRRMGRRRPAPTPPYTETDMAFIARRSRDSPRPSSLTPALSPSRLSPPEGEAETSNVRNEQEESDFAALVAARASRYRALREEHIERADRFRAINEGRSRSSFREFLQRTRMDGLGDRDRSPEGGEAWDTLLTSITPDPQPPSAGSSFASSSAAAAATSSSSNSGPAWVGRSMTSPERSGESPGLRDCDEPTSSDSDTDDDDGELEDFSVLVDSARTRGDRPWTSSYADVTRANRGAQSPDQSLEGMHRIISRLAERDDIPESWWASVGLRREPSA